MLCQENHLIDEKNVFPTEVCTVHKQAFSRTGEIVLHFAHTGRGEATLHTRRRREFLWPHRERRATLDVRRRDSATLFAHRARRSYTSHTRGYTRTPNTQGEVGLHSTDIRLHGREKQLQRRARREKLSFDTMLQLLQEDDEQGCMAYKLVRSLHWQRVFVLSEHV